VRQSGLIWQMQGRKRMRGNSKGQRSEREYKHHRTIDRVIRVLEEVVFSPGITFGDLSRKLDVPKSTLHGFVEGLLASGWLFEHSDHSRNHLFLGPAVYGLIVSSGHVRAGQVTNGDLYELQSRIETEVYLGVLVGESLIYIAEAGGNPVGSFHSRTYLRRKALLSAGGKALLATRADAEIETFLRQRPEEEAQAVDEFVNEVSRIRRTGLATNHTHGGRRFAIAAVVKDPTGKAVAALISVGPTDKVEPRKDEIGHELLEHLHQWRQRSVSAREAI
jgi:DNA-binding IclR family transcriptional regulator